MLMVTLYIEGGQNRPAGHAHPSSYLKVIFCSLYTEIQTLQGDQVHYEGWEVPSSVIELA